MEKLLLCGINWLEGYLPGTTDNFVSDKVIIWYLDVAEV